MTIIAAPPEGAPGGTPGPAQGARRRPLGALVDRVPPKLRRIVVRGAVGFGLLLWVVAGANGGPRGAILASVIAVLVAAGMVIRPGVRRWLLDESPTDDVPPRRRSAFLADVARRTTGTPLREATTAMVLLVLVVGVSVAASSLGEKAIVILVGLIALLAMVAFVKNRTLFFMFVFAASMSLIMYKKFTPFLAESYAVAIYITTVNVVTLFLYLVWAAEGTLFRDLRAGLKDKVFMLPVIGLAVTLLSAVNANDQRLVWAELTRYLWLIAVFVYVGIRVRRKEHIWAFMVGWLVFLAVQLMVSTSQRFTGGFLGIEIFALRPDPMQPFSTEYMRPYGTQIHPVFLGCVVGMVCVMVACFALHVPKHKMVRYLLLACIPLAFVPSFFARARGVLVALPPTLLFIAFMAVRRKMLNPRILIVGVLVGLIGLGVMHQPAMQLANSFFGTDRGRSSASDNWNARWKINEIAFRMIRDEPLVGIGINSFENQIDKYTYEENPFDFRPAHNLYILMAAETGFLGLGMMLVIGLVFGYYAYRLTRARDPMYVSLGIGGLGFLIFIAVEEINSFTLKQDVPLTMFWVVFGLLVAANRMAEQEPTELPGIPWFRPTRDDAPESAAGDGSSVAAGGVAR